MSKRQNSDADVEIQDEIDLASGLQCRFHPTKSVADYLSFAQEGDEAFEFERKKKEGSDEVAASAIETSNTEDDTWRGYPRDQKDDIIKATVRFIVMTAHCGRKCIDPADLKKYIEAKGLPWISWKCYLDKSQEQLKAAFGYECVVAREVNTDGDAVDTEWNLLATKPARVVVRMSASAVGTYRKGQPPSRLGAHSAALLNHDSSPATKLKAQRGLLMAILTLLLGCKNLQIAETTLFDLLLQMDPQLSGGRKQRGARGGDDDEFDDSDHPLGKDWKKTISDDFLRQGYLEKVDVQTDEQQADGAGGDGAAGGGKVRGYRIGVRLRAVLGAPAIYEYATSIKAGNGANVGEATLITKDAVRSLLVTELGRWVDSLPENRIASELGKLDDDNEDQQDGKGKKANLKK